MAFKRRRWTFFFLATFVLSPAFAQPTASDRETARSLLNEGDKKFSAKEYPAALRAYQAAHNIMGVPTTGIELVKVQVALGMLLEARDTALQIRRYPNRPGEPPPFAKARADAEEIARQLAQRIGAVRVVLQGVTPGKDVDVTIDANPIASAAVSIPYKVNPGTHVVTAKAAGYALERGEVVVREGETKDVTLTLKLASEPTETVAPPPSVAPVAAPTKQTSPLVYVGFGLAAAGVAVGSVTGLLSLTKTSQAKDLCVDTTCPSSAKDSIDQAKGLALVSNVSFAVGVVGLGLGIVGLFVGGPSKIHEPQTARVYPVLDANRIGLAGSFLPHVFSCVSKA